MSASHGPDLSRRRDRGRVHASTLASVVLLGATVIWGSTFVLVDRVVEDVPVHTFLALRFSIATVALLALRPRSLVGLQMSTLRRGVVLGLALGVGYATQTAGLALGTLPTVSGFITGMFVVLTPLLAAWWFRARIGWATTGAVVTAGTGLALLTLVDGRVGGGEAVTAVCAVAFAAQIVLLGQWATPSNTLALVVIQLATVSVIEIALALIVERPLALPESTSSWGGIVFLALAATVYGFLAQTWAQAHMTATRAAVILTAEPMFAAATGVVTGDRLLPRQMVGAVLVLAAMYLVELSPRARGGREKAEAALPHLEP
ncbi:MAG: DMT family transporter [Actinobacteria bacterium]|nr:DMT family transporter [Actinomycetota bacterium]